MKDIPGYEGLYAATKNGRIWSYPKRTKTINHSGKFLKPYIMKSGYLVVSLYKDKKFTRFLVHRLVASVFLENTKLLPEVNHKNAIKSNNSVPNLEWITSEGNNEHSKRMGLPWKGSMYAHAKLSEKDVRLIKILYRTKKRGFYVEMARQYNVSSKCIQLICNGKNWKHI